jgi:hypothetical protein
MRGRYLAPPRWSTKVGGARAVTIADARMPRMHCAQQILLAPFFGTG